jgi:hypothetical protein
MLADINLNYINSRDQLTCVNADLILQSKFVLIEINI